MTDPNKYAFRMLFVLILVIILIGLLFNHHGLLDTLQLDHRSEIFIFPRELPARSQVSLGSRCAPGEDGKPPPTSNGLAEDEALRRRPPPIDR